MMRKRALITGGSRGIGLAIREEFERNGIETLIPTRNELDLTSNLSIKNYLSSLTEPIDILVNNAGINPIGEFIHLNQYDIDETVHVNFLAPFLLIQTILPMMIRQGSGRIVNLSSIWSVISKPKRSIYASTKAAINSLTKSLAVEYGQYNILVNAVAPGFVNTELTKQNNTDTEIQKISETIPLKRLAEPGEIANLVYFLCSEKNTFITGQTILIDGGFTCQ